VVTRSMYDFSFKIITDNYRRMEIFVNTSDKRVFFFITLSSPTFMVHPAKSAIARCKRGPGVDTS